LRLKVPRAMQALGDPHDTLPRLDHPAPAGLGRFWIDHVLPFQRSTSACCPAGLS
jgi:hypothetical protein